MRIWKLWSALFQFLYIFLFSPLNFKDIYFWAPTYFMDQTGGSLQDGKEKLLNAIQLYNTTYVVY